MKQPAKQNKSLAVQPSADITPEVMEKVLIGADLAGLNPAQRLEYYKALCQSLELNPLTRPFEYITLDGKCVLYARKDCTDQLRKKEGITIAVKSRVTEDGVHVVTVSAKNAAGREDEAIGTAAMDEPEFTLEWSNGKKAWTKNPKYGSKLPPEKRALALMKAETKAKRRVTLSLGGLGMLDETEVESIQTADAPAMIERQVEERKQLTEAEDKEKTRQVEAAGGTVETFVPEKKKVSSPTPADWREVKCHFGTTKALWLGEKLGKLPGAQLRALQERIPKYAPNPNEKDKVLIAAINEGVTALDATPVESPEPDTLTTEETKPETAKKRTAKAKDAPADWRSVVIHIGKLLSGKTLAFVADSKPGEIMKGMDSRGVLEWLYAQGIPKIEAKGAEMDEKDKALIVAIKAACGELMLNADCMRAEIARRIDALGLPLAFAEVKLCDAGILEAEQTIAGLDEPLLKYTLENWTAVEDALKK